MVLKMQLARTRFNYDGLSILDKTKLGCYAICLVDLDLLQIVIEKSFTIPDSRTVKVYCDTTTFRVSPLPVLNYPSCQAYRSNPCAFRAMSRSGESNRSPELSSSRPVISSTDNDR